MSTSGYIVIDQLLPQLKQTAQKAPVLSALVEARAAVAELRGTVKSLPNPEILLDTLFLQEALVSSMIENIVTTQDEAFKASLSTDDATPQAKEVARYHRAMSGAYKQWQTHKLITEGMLIDMFRTLHRHDGGYRVTPGTVLRNEQTGETVYTPPQDPQEIIHLMRDLEAFINADASDLDPLIKMALIHYQFESIHPFPDGNGRIGRMLNVLYLTHVDLLDDPILYLSRAINATKQNYYRLLRVVGNHGAWEEWLIYMLNAVTDAARSTLWLVEEIRELMRKTKKQIRDELPKIYSQDLLNHLFRYPYTRLGHLERDLPQGRQTVRKYLKKLSDAGVVDQHKVGRSNYYINMQLCDLLLRVSEGAQKSRGA